MNEGPRMEAELRRPSIPGGPVESRRDLVRDDVAVLTLRLESC